MKKLIASPATLTLVWIFFFTLTHWPIEEMPETPNIPYVDKVVHFSMFTILGFLLSHRISAGGNLKKQFTMVLAILAAYAAFDELTQPLVGRTTELFDWIADMCGASLGVVGYSLKAKKNVQAKHLHD